MEKIKTSKKDLKEELKEDSTKENKKTPSKSFGFDCVKTGVEIIVFILLCMCLVSLLNYAFNEHFSTQNEKFMMFCMNKSNYTDFVTKWVCNWVISWCDFINNIDICRPLNSS